MDELKPCPKCGSHLLHMGATRRFGMPSFVYRIKRVVYKRGVGCVVCGYNKRTVKAWNRRASDA